MNPGDGENSSRENGGGYDGGRYYLVKLCTSKAAHEAVPADRGGPGYDLARAEGLLKAAGYTVTNAGVLLAAASPGGLETTLFPSGKLLVNTGDREAAVREVDRIHTIIGPARR